MIRIVTVVSLLATWSPETLDAHSLLESVVVAWSEGDDGDGPAYSCDGSACYQWSRPDGGFVEAPGVEEPTLERDGSRLCWSPAHQGASPRCVTIGKALAARLDRLSLDPPYLPSFDLKWWHIPENDIGDFVWDIAADKSIRLQEPPRAPISELEPVELEEPRQLVELHYVGPLILGIWSNCAGPCELAQLVDPTSGRRIGSPFSVIGSNYHAAVALGPDRILIARDEWSGDRHRPELQLLDTRGRVLATKRLPRYHRDEWPEPGGLLRTGPRTAVFAWKRHMVSADGEDLMEDELRLVRVEGRALEVSRVRSRRDK